MGLGQHAVLILHLLELADVSFFVHDLAGQRRLVGEALAMAEAAQRNDLQDPAVALEPAISETLTAVAATPGVALARMSGSGATVFGLCFDAETAAMAADRLSAWRPGWWVRACVLGGPSA